MVASTSDPIKNQDPSVSSTQLSATFCKKGFVFSIQPKQQLFKSSDNTSWKSLRKQYVRDTFKVLQNVSIPEWKGLF